MGFNSGFKALIADRHRCVLQIKSFWTG